MCGTSALEAIRSQSLIPTYLPICVFTSGRLPEYSELVCLKYKYLIYVVPIGLKEKVNFLIEVSFITVVLYVSGMHVVYLGENALKMLSGVHDLSE